jgi:NitT/TauT family transport system substrate-binding protein
MRTIARTAMRLAAGAVLLGALLAPRPAAADDSLRLILGSTAFGLGDVVQFVAEDEGFYKQQHLDVDRQEANNPAICAQLVASGKGDVCAMNVVPILTGYDKGLRLQLFLSRVGRFSYVLGVSDDSPIRTLADFKGATLGEISVGVGEAVAPSMLAEGGLHPSDVTYLAIGSGPQAIAALNDKRVTALVFPYLELVKYDVIYHQKYRIFYHPILSDISDVGYAASPATIQARPDVLARFARALVEAAVFVRANPVASARIFLRDAPGKKPTEDDVRNVTRELILCRQYLPAADPLSKRIGLLHAQGIEYLSQALTAAGIGRTVVPADAVMTNQFVDFANDFDHKAVIAQARKLGTGPQ